MHSGAADAIDPDGYATEDARRALGPKVASVHGFSLNGMASKLGWVGSKLSTALGLVLVLGFSGLAIYAVIVGLLEDPGLVGTCITAAAALGAILLQRDREKKREVAQRHREQLSPLYESLMKRFNNADSFAEDEGQEFVSELQRKLILYGTTPVVEAWLIWWRAIQSEHVEGDPTLLLLWENVMFTLRDDLGHPRGNLTQGDLLRIYIHDADEALGRDLTT